MSDTLIPIRAILTTTPLRWSQLTASVPDGLLRQPPAAGEWSAMECLQHLVDTERWVFPARLEALRHGHDIPAFDPLSQGTLGAPEKSPAVLAATFTQLRATSLAALSAVNEDDFGRHGQHSELGTVTLGELLHEWAAHDLDHTIQAERAVMQPFIRGCGPWHFYFAKNRIDMENANET